jgi:hypothetical protein
MGRPEMWIASDIVFKRKGLYSLATFLSWMITYPQFVCWQVGELPKCVILLGDDHEKIENLENCTMAMAIGIYV